jgi:mutator protein MutT
MAQRPRLVQAAIAVIERDGCYLVSRRRAKDYLGGFWEFPGGKRQVGESWEACLRRELREELDVTVKVVERLTPLCFRYPDRVVRLEVFRCAIASGTPKPLGCQAVRWVRPIQLARLRFPPADRPLLKRLTGNTRAGRRRA